MPDTLDVLAAIEKFRGTRPDPRGLHRGARSVAAAALLRSPPRRRSIPHRLALTVDAVRYPIGGAQRGVGVALDLLRRSYRGPARRSRRLCAAGRQHFALAGRFVRCPVVMIGPGNRDPHRSAPFCTSAWPPRRPGRKLAVLRTSAASGYDFFYEDELSGNEGPRAGAHPPDRSPGSARRQGKRSMSRTACANVGPRPVGVARGMGRAHSMYAATPKRMAKDVGGSPHPRVVATFGLRSTNEAIGFVAEMKEERGALPARMCIETHVKRARARRKLFRVTSKPSHHETPWRKIDPTVRSNLPVIAGSAAGLLAQPEAGGGGAADRGAIRPHPAKSGDGSARRVSGRSTRPSACKGTPAPPHAAAKRTERLPAPTGTRRSIRFADGFSAGIIERDGARRGPPFYLSGPTP